MAEKKSPTVLAEDLSSENATQLYTLGGRGTVGFAGTARLDWEDAAGPTSRTVTQSIVVGSSPNADVVLCDPTTSRLHAALEVHDDGIWVRDLQSSNGTWLEGIRVERALVPHLGRIRVGQTDLVLSHVRGGAGHTEEESWPEPRFHRLLGGSRKMRALYATLSRVAVSDAPVLILGDTGTGKELVARSIHEASPRARGPFIVIDCAALPENLLDGELFGHTRGAFTGATSARAGAIESANGGTVFIDEIGELPKSMQPKLLRVLEAKTVRRLGEHAHRPVDVRFVFATHRDLLKMVSTSEFREDLYFRLGVLPVRVPALRERLDDLEMLVGHFMGDGGTIGPDVVAALQARAWTGNVRELRNFVDRIRTLGYERALAISDVHAPVPGFGLRTSDTPQAFSVDSTPPSSQRFPSVEPSASSQRLQNADAAPSSQRYPLPDPLPPPNSRSTAIDLSTTGSFRSFRDRWNEFGEQKYVEDLLARHSRNVSAAAREAEVDRTYLYKLIRKYRF